MSIQVNRVAKTYDNELSRRLQFEIEKMEDRDAEILRLRRVIYHMTKYAPLYMVGAFLAGVIAAAIVII